MIYHGRVASASVSQSSTAFIRQPDASSVIHMPMICKIFFRSSADSSVNMSDYFDSDDPFADFTAADLETIEHAAIEATQRSQPVPLRPPPHSIIPQRQITRLPSYQPAIPILEEDPTLEDDDYGQFNVDEEDLILDTSNPVDQPLLPPSQPQPAQPPTITTTSSSSIHTELTHLRAEIARLKAERDTFETKAYSQDGKLDHLQRTLQRTQADHAAVLQRLQNVAETEKRRLREDLAERERRLARISAELEFQKNEVRQAREERNAGAGGVVVPMVGTVGGVNGEGSPKKARVVRGSGVKSPESKSKIGVFSARAFGKEGVVPAKQKKRKRGEEEVMEQVIPMQVEQNRITEAEVNRMVMEKILQGRTLWTSSDERFDVFLESDCADGSCCRIFLHITMALKKRFPRFRKFSLLMRNIRSRR